MLSTVFFNNYFSTLHQWVPISTCGFIYQCNGQANLSSFWIQTLTHKVRDSHPNQQCLEFKCQTTLFEIQTLSHNVGKSAHQQTYRGFAYTPVKMDGRQRGREVRWSPIRDTLMLVQ